MATAEVLRAHSIVMPAPQRIKAGSYRRAAGSSSHPSAVRTSPPAGKSPPAAGRRDHGRNRKARPAAEVYAGPSFSTSPEPSSLPLPRFPTKKSLAVAAVDAAATRDLRRMLWLE